MICLSMHFDVSYITLIDQTHKASKSKFKHYIEQINLNLLTTLYWESSNVSFIEQINAKLLNTY